MGLITMIWQYLIPQKNTEVAPLASERVLLKLSCFDMSYEELAGGFAKKYMYYEPKIKFPIYVLSEEPEEIDGLVLIGDQVVDDKNMSGATIGMRRLQTPMKSIYPLRYQVDDEVGMMKHKGKHFIDTNGDIGMTKKLKQHLKIS